MSFEIDQEKLANPPRKSDQEAITSFWGLYRWPFKTYNRYSQLEGLEQTADETRTMAKALRFVDCAKELGLSIDGGLGWLAGPDINQRVAERGGSFVVFGASKFIPEKPRPSRAARLFGLPNTEAGQSASLQSSFERMLQEAGYDGETLESSIQMLLETEGLSHEAPSTASGPWESSNTPNLLEQWRRPRRRMAFDLLGNHTTTAQDNYRAEIFDEEMLEDDVAVQRALSSMPKPSTTKSETCSLKPNDLTNAQREMLLEMEWAQNAFMQSWAIAIMDNHQIFLQIETLNIARLPNKHLSILRREDFWDSLPELKSLSLAIIPDWREVKKEATSWVQDTRLAPSQSVQGAYDLISQQISRRKNIKTLHFEWLGGGEYAPGLFARNHHILAAPVVSQAMHMVNRSQQHPVLTLPHIEHLSLKNCWVSPHILSRFLGSMRKGVLESITLDSVSLTAMVPSHAAPNPVTPAAAVQNAQNAAGAAAANNMIMNLQGAAAAQFQNGPFIQAGQPPTAPVAPVPNNSNNQLAWLDAPRQGSWADIINNITPGKTLADIRYERETGPEPEPKPTTNLSKLSFTSCGYARLPLDFDQSILDPTIPVSAQTAAMTKRINDIDPHMMKPADFTMGIIVNHIDAVETSALENAWNMNVGWRFSRTELYADALLDGVMSAGIGRFDGLIEIQRQSISRSSRRRA